MIREARWLLCPSCHRVDSLVAAQPAKCSRCQAPLWPLSQERFAARYAAGEFYEVTAPDRAADTLPPTPAELSTDLLLLDSRNRQILDRTGHGNVRMPWVRWIAAPS